MFSLSRGGLILALAAVLLLPMAASAQIGFGVPGIGIGGIGGMGQQLGPPPAGVLLHQQYMQLYGLPTSFLQGQVNNGGGVGILGGYGYGYGGFPRYFGVNYQRNLAALQALQAYQAAAMHNYYGGYGLSNPYYTLSAPAASSASTPTYSSFGISANQPSFGQSSLATRTIGTPTFGGFGLSNTANPFITDQKKDEKKEDK